MKDRARGCFTGQLVGDALGSQVEFMGSDKIRELFPDGVRTLSSSLTWHTLPGQVTDDSEMALALARTLASGSGYDAAAVRRAYAEWLRSGPFDCGNTIHAALTGHPSPQSQANGALMRASPLGIWGARRDREELWEAAGQDAMLTHVHPVCRQANRIFVTLIARAVAGDEQGPELYSALSRDPQAFCGEPVLPEIAERIALAGKEKPVLDRENKGWVLLAFQNALYHLAHAGGFEQAVVDTVMGGGDTDTNAAICGALMGAVLGFSAIPEAWADTVFGCRPDSRSEYPRPRCFWAADALELADRLLDGPQEKGRGKGSGTPG